MLKDKLKELRTNRKLTKKEVAEATGLTERQYIAYEYGERDVSTDTLIALADFYGVTTDYLLGREPPENAPNPLDSLGLNSLDKAIVQAYIALKPAERTQLVELLTKIADGAKPEITLIEPEKKKTAALCHNQRTARSSFRR